MVHGVDFIDCHLNLVGIVICHVRFGEKSGGTVRKQDIFGRRNAVSVFLKRDGIQHLVDITVELLKFCKERLMKTDKNLESALEELKNALGE